MFLNRLARLGQRSAVRQALALVGVFALVSVVTWGMTYVFSARELTRQVDLRLTETLSATRRAVQQGLSLPDAGVGQTIAVVERGVLVAGTLPRSLSGHALSEGFHDHRPDGEHASDLRYVVRQVGAGQVIVSENVERQDELLEILTGGVQIAVIAPLLASVIAAVVMGLRAQARLNTIGAGLTRVARGHLETRIALEGPRDDLSHLSDRINLTTAQLEAAVQNLRVQSANIAHDLRTPLARLRAVLESRLSALETRGTPVTAEDLEAALGHIDQIVGTFDALLRIARVESGAARSEFQTIDLERVSHDFLEIYAPVVEEQGQRLELVTTAPAHIRGDRALILQALANLVQNALRYGAQDQTITLKVSGRTLTVTDQGPGIRQEKIEQVLQPLFQLETTRQSEGFGLGLSLVKAVCDLHDADLTLGPGPDARGLCVQIRFAGADSG